MPDLSYRQAGLTLQRGGRDATEQQIRELQRNLRSLGYLRGGIDGVFGGGTEKAVRALQYDLLANDGTGSGGNGTAPVNMTKYNRGRVAAVTGQVGQAIVECISDILDDRDFPTLPSADDPVQENQAIALQIAAMPPGDVPIPFLMAILKQESNLKHFVEPAQGNDDTYIVVGLDTNDAAHPDRITSRGYGVGQYTLFHHPPTPQEVNDVMLDVGKNLSKAVAELRNKYDQFVNGPTPATQAEDRRAEFGNGPLRLCKYSTDDPRYMRDCKQCAMDAGTHDITAGVTTLYKGSAQTYQPTQYYANASYSNVAVRGNIGCDWPYAARRYNGSGMNSYHYQVRVLKNLGQN